MSEKKTILLCSQDKWIGEIISGALSSLKLLCVPLYGSYVQSAGSILRCKADLVIAEAGRHSAEYLEIFKIMHSRFPQQRYLLISSDIGCENRAADCAEVSFLAKPFTSAEVCKAVQMLLGSSLQISSSDKIVSRLICYCISAAHFLCRVMKLRLTLDAAAGAVSYFTKFWQRWLRRAATASLNADRENMWKHAHQFMMSEYSSAKTAASVWRRLEFLERRYLLMREGFWVDSEALGAYYRLLAEQLHSGLKGCIVCPGSGDRLVPELSDGRFSRFYLLVRRKGISAELFRAAAEVRLIVSCARITKERSPARISGSSGGIEHRREGVLSEVEVIGRMRSKYIDFYNLLWN